MKRVLLVVGLLVAFLSTGVLFGCEKTSEAKVTVEKLPDITPNLPQVPVLPPPPYPTQYGDQSYSVFGLRKMLRTTINTSVSVTGYVAKVFQPPPCPEGERCPTPTAPHLWLADKTDETDSAKMLLVAGYAENQGQLDESIEAATKGQLLLPPEGSDTPPIPIDLFVGAKAKFQGRFAYDSVGFAMGRGFQSSEGVMSYSSHQTLEPSPLMPKYPPDLKPVQMAGETPE